METFKLESRQIGASRTRWQVAICGICGAREGVQNNTATAMPPDAIAPRFRRLGWQIASRRKADICPACNAALNGKLEPGKPIKTVMPKPQEPAMPADPPPVPNQADRFRVLDAIDEHWNRDRNCYLRAFSDESLATKLDVPRAWVTQVREMFFGPDQNEAKDETARMLKQLPQLTARAKALEERSMALAAEAEGLRLEIDKLYAVAGVESASA